MKLQQSQEDRAEALQRFRRMTLPFSVDMEQKCIIYKLPGLGYSDIGRTGLPMIWSVAKLLESFAYTDPLNLIPKRTVGKALSPMPFPNVIRVIRAQCFIISPAFYDRACLDWPLHLTCGIGGASKSAFSFLLKLVDQKDGRLLVLNNRVITKLDTKLKKSVTFSAEDVETLQSVAANESSVKVTFPEEQNESFRYDVKVAHSDTDSLYHLNHSNWLKHCMDCACEAVKQDFFKNFKTDPLSYKIKEVNVRHDKEAFPGDLVTVTASEFNDTKDMLLFKVFKNSDLCLLCSIQLHASAKL